MFVTVFRSLFGRRLTPARSIAIVTLSAALLSACSLAAPAPVGNIQQPPVAQQPSTQPLELPTRKPSAAQGAALYQEKCAGCHGAQGRGDGEKAAQIKASFGGAVADLASDVVARAQSPELWYNMVTNGNLQAGMPPFAGSLDVNQRWDVIAYAWTLAAPRAEIDKGQEVYARQCVHCHGATGKGDGPDAQGQLPDFSQFDTFTKVEAGKWDQALASTHVPSFAGTTSELERRAVIDYARTFAYDYEAPGGATSTASSTPAAPANGASSAPNPTNPDAPVGATKIEGYLLNGTAGQPVPGNLPITFYIFPGGTGQNAVTQTLRTDAQGRFTLTTTQVTPTDLIAATTEYNQLNFFSALTNYAPQVTLPITVYEHTTDAANVQIATLHIVAMPAADGLQVSEIYVLSNTGDRIVAGFGQPVMQLGLPQAATQFAPDSNMPSNVLEKTDNGLAYFDAIPVGENAGQIIFQYVVPNGPYVLDRPLMQKVDSVNLLVEGDPDQVNVSGNQFTAAGTQDIQGKTYQVFHASNLAAGQTLAVTVASGGAAFDWRILAGIALVAVGVIGLVVWVRSRRPTVSWATDSAAQQDALIDQIAALDDDFAAGQLDEINYRAKRARLKERLLRVISNQ